MNWMSKIRQELRSYLDEHSMRVETFAVKCGVASKTIYIFLKGENPAVDTLNRIAQAMGKELDVNFKDAA